METTNRGLNLSKKKSRSLSEYLISAEADVQNICRVCLSTDNKVLFTLLHSSDTNILSNMFSNLTSITVNKEDKLPNSVCVECQKQIIHCYEFKINCIESDQMLKSLFNEYTTKEVALISENNTKNDESHSKEHYNQAEHEYLEDILSDDETLYIVNKEESHEQYLNKYKKKLKKYYPCSFCSKKFKQQKYLKNHINKHHENKYTGPGFSCKHCKEQFLLENDLKIHEIIHSKGPNWKCIKCEKEFKVKHALRRHLQRHMEVKRFSCEVCSKTFVEKCALLRHMRTHTGERPEKKFVCQYCDKRFAERSQLCTHEARHSGGRACACECGKAFASPRLLASHRRVHQQHKPYACKYCDKRFRHESTLRTHHRTHTGERPYVCTVCGKAFIQNSNMTLHMRSHTGERPYACSQCDRRFSTGWTLKMHLQTHTGEKPFKCNVCGKSFARKNMKLHMRLHTGERPHACSVCPKKFTYPTRLRDHYRLHTGERPFECAECPEKFITKSHLIKHVKNHAKKTANKKSVVMYRPFTVNHKNNEDELIIVNKNEVKDDSKMNEVTLGPIHEGPMEVAQELMLHDNNVKTEVILLENGEMLPSNQVSYVNANNVNLNNDVKYLTVNEDGGAVSISSSNAIVEGTAVKLYQLDQSLLQIHSTGCQLTISKITSKMTANF